MKVNQYTFLKKQIPAVKNFIEKKLQAVPNWAVELRGGLSVKKGKLFYENKQIVPEEDVKQILRNDVYKSKSVEGLPYGRDSMYNVIQDKYVGISKRDVEDFMKLQKAIRKTDPVRPESKSPGERIKGYVAECDLVEVKLHDLPPRIKKQFKKNFYLSGIAERATGLVYYERVMRKTAEMVVPTLARGLKWINAQLEHGKIEKFVSDAGGEYPQSFFDKRSLPREVKKLGPLIENRNRLIQSNLYKNINAKIGSFDICLKKAVNQINSTKNKNTKYTPNQAAKVSKSTILERYNAGRVKPSEKKVIPYERGDRVRLNVKDKKDRFYKSYKGDQWQEYWKIIGATKKPPIRYRIQKGDVKKWVMHSKVQRYGKKGVVEDKISRAGLEKREQVNRMLDKAKEKIDLPANQLKKIDKVDLEKVAALPKQQSIKVDGKKIAKLGRAGSPLKKVTIKVLTGKKVPSAKPKSKITGKGSRKDPYKVDSQKMVLSKAAPRNRWYKLGNLLLFKRDERKIYKSNVQKWFVLSKDNKKWLAVASKK